MKICPLCRRKYENAEAGFCPYDRQALVEEENPAAQFQMPQTNGVEQVALPFSGSLAAAFFPQHFVEVKPPDTGLAPPCQPKVRVDTIQLAVAMPMAAFWYLRENNCIRFAPGIQTGFFSSDLALFIEVNRSQQPSIPGLEHDFWAIISRSLPGMTVEAVVKQFIGRKNFTPQSEIYDRMKEWMIQLGYGQVDTSIPFFRFRDDGRREIFEFLPDCGRIAQQQQAAQTIHRHWIKFRTEQPDIYSYLFEDVRRALEDCCTRTTFTLPL